MNTAMRYLSHSWEVAISLKGDRHSEFARHLRKNSRPLQIAYQRLMRAYSGEPIGVELKSTSREAWAFVLPDASGDKPWRIQYFDQNGFQGHGPREKLEAAVEEMLGEGYRTLDIGALDRLAGTPQWVLGMQRNAVMQRHQHGLITFEEMLQELNAVSDGKAVRLVA